MLSPITPLAMVLGLLLCQVPADAPNAPFHWTLKAACTAGTHSSPHGWGHTDTEGTGNQQHKQPTHHPESQAHLSPVPEVPNRNGGNTGTLNSHAKQPLNVLMLIFQIEALKLDPLTMQFPDLDLHPPELLLK